MYFNFHTHIQHHFDVEILNYDRDKNLSSGFFSCGIHPQDALKKLTFPEDFFLSESCLAIGECGLDKQIDVDFRSQQDTFIEQIMLSEKHKLPLILHCVKAWNEVLQLKKELKPKQTWIFHGFRKTNLLDDVLKQGLMVGIGGAVLYDTKLQAAIQKIPLDRLLLETDDDAKTGIEAIYEKTAEIKRLSLPDLKIQMEQNFKRTFLKFTPDNSVNF